MTIKSFLFSSIALIVLPVLMQAQSMKAYEKAGDKAFAAKDYYTAFVHFREAIELEPEEVRLWFKYAEVARQFNAYEEAEIYFAKVWESEESSTFPLAGFWLAQTKKSLGKYNEAIEILEAFLQKSASDDYYTQWAKREMETCRWAIDLQPPAGKRITVEHLDKKINTPYSEFGAVETGSTLYYSSYRFDFPDDSHQPERKLSKVLASENGGKGRVLSRGFNDDKKLTAHTTFSINGTRIYFTLCEYVTSTDLRCEIYYRDKDKRGRWEPDANRLPEIINLKGYTATQPNIGYDTVAKKEVLFFVSDRPNGKGKLDIWYCELDKDKFLEPKNLEAVNTPENDITPFFQTEEQTLYFSSEGYPGLGGYDVYNISKSPDWGEANNLGKPVNTSYHDIYYSLNKTEDVAWLSSNRPGSFYLDASNKACCHDIYKVTYAEIPPDTTGQPPVVIPPPPPPVPSVPTTLEDFLPLALYFDNDEPDKRTNRTTTKKSYETTYFKFYDRKREYIERFTKPMTEDEASDAALDLEDYFENEVKKGYDFLQLFSNILLKRLENGERVEIVIKGYTSPRAKSDYNDNLAKRRISSLRNQFDSYRNGIFKDYLDKGKLVITEAPFGETKASGTVSDDLIDERNSIYSVPASKERRVEIVEVK